MFIVELECENRHAFEGWYDRASEFHEIRDAGELTCPLCESHNVTQTLATGSIKTTKTEARQTRRPPSPEKVPLEVQQAMAKVVQWVRKTHDDVGSDFAATARRIHRGDEPQRLIRGTSTPAEEKELQKEGVPFLKVPVPDIEQN